MKETMELLKGIAEVFGPFFGTLFFLTLLSISLILVYFKSRIEKIAEEISIKALKTFETQQSLAVRDENIRQELVLYQAKKSIDKKLELFEDVTKLYFKYQNTWELLKDVKANSKKIQIIWTEILDMRRKILLNNVYLGGPLTDSLLKSVVSMWSILERRLQEAKYKDLEKFGIYSYKDDDLFKSETELGDYLSKSEKYIRDYLYSNQNIKQYDYTEEEKAFLEKEKGKIFQSN